MLGVSGGEPTHQRPLELTTKKKKKGDVGSCHWPATPKCWSLDRYAVPPLGCGELRAFDYCAIHVIGIAHVSRKFHSRDLWSGLELKNTRGVLDFIHAHVMVKVTVDL